MKGITLTEIGYDIRVGSHCGAGAPRFNIATTTGKLYFLGCSSPPPTGTNFGTGWKGLIWTFNGTVSAYNASTGLLEVIADPIQSMSIVFDEGQDTDPIGLAVLATTSTSIWCFKGSRRGSKLDPGDRLEDAADKTHARRLFDNSVFIRRAIDDQGAGGQ